MNTGQLVREKINELGIKQSWLASQLNISNSTLSSMLNTDLKSSTLFRICELLGISIDEIYSDYQKKDVATSAKNTATSKNTKLHK